MSSGPSSVDPARIPTAGSGSPVPSLDRLREALRAPETPLTFPATTAAAAQRVRDLVHAERFSEARYVLRHSDGRDAAPEERLALQRAAALLAVRSGDSAATAEAFAGIVETLVAAGFGDQARACAQVLGDRMDARARSRSARALRQESERTAASGGEPGMTPARSVIAHAETARSVGGRRRGNEPSLCPALLAVVGGIEVPPDPSAAPRRELMRLREAVRAVPEVSAALIDDPAPLLAGRLALLCEGAGLRADALGLALDVLELIAERESRAGGYRDPERVRTTAHAILSRSLLESDPLTAVEHGLLALESVSEVDDPPLRVGLATALLQALMAAGLEEHSSFTAGRLLGLQRSLRRDSHRIAPLIAVGAQRVRAQRYDAARVPLLEAQRLAREARDRLASLEASRLLALLSQETGEADAALAHLRRTAADAAWAADDLLVSTADRNRYVRDELNANALVLRYALESGDRRAAEQAARAIIRRTGPGEATLQLGAPLRWDHEVDARVGALLAAGIGLRDGAPEVSENDYDRRRQEAMEAIGRVPDGHEERARYWGTYLEDRHARMLAERGDLRRAVRAAHRSRGGWAALGRAEDQESLEREIAAWNDALAQEDAAAAEAEDPATEAAGGAAGGQPRRRAVRRRRP